MYEHQGRSCPRAPRLDSLGHEERIHKLREWTLKKPRQTQDLPGKRIILKAESQDDRAKMALAKLGSDAVCPGQLACSQCHECVVQTQLQATHLRRQPGNPSLAKCWRCH